MAERIAFVGIVIVLCSIPFYFAYGKEFLIPYITLLAVIVALFREKIINYFFPPILKISLTDESGHFAVIESRNQKTDEFHDMLVKIGVVVENVGKAKADNVQLYFSGLESNVINSFERYRSIPLLRSWTANETLIRSLPKSVPIVFDIGFIELEKAKEFNFKLSLTSHALRKIKCICKTEKVEYPTLIKFEIKAVCDNAKISTAVMKIDYNCEWKDGIKVSLS